MIFFFRVILIYVFLFNVVKSYISSSITFQSFQNISTFISTKSDITSDLLYVALTNGVGIVKIYKYNSMLEYVQEGSFSVTGTFVSINQDASKIMISSSGNPKIYPINKGSIPYTLGAPFDFGVSGFAESTRDLQFVSIAFNLILKIFKWNSGTSTYNLLNTFSLAIASIRAMAWADQCSKLFVGNNAVQVYEFDGNSSFTFQQSLSGSLSGGGSSISLSCTDDGSRVVHGLAMQVWVFEYTNGGYVSIQNFGQNTDLNTNFAVGLSPDGKYLVFGGSPVTATNTARVYYKADNSIVYNLLQTFSTGPTNNHKSFIFSKNNQILIISMSVYSQIRFKCKPNCNFCSPSYEICTACTAGFTLNNVTNDCSCSAGTNYTVDMFGNCVECSIAECEYCFAANKCGFCSNNFILFNNSCLCIGSRQIFNGTCIPCEIENCDYCSDVNICDSCLNNYTLGNGTCICFGAVVNSTCINCTVIDCLECNDTDVCSQCITGFILDANNTCTCDANRSISNESGFCVNCQINYCISCDFQSYCSSCQTNFTLVNGRCLCLYPRTVSINGTCVLCQIDNCQQCDVQDFCSVCADTNFTINATGVCECPGYVVNGFCMMCDVLNCISCNAIGLCATCDPGFNLTYGYCSNSTSTSNGTNILPSSSNSFTSNNNNSDFIIILIILGIIIGIILLLLVALIVYICQKQKSKEIRAEQERQNMNEKQKLKSSISITEQNLNDDTLQDLKVTKLLREKRPKVINRLQSLNKLQSLIQQRQFNKLSTQNKVKKAAMQNWTIVKVQKSSSQLQASNQSLKASYLQSIDIPNPKRKVNKKVQISKQQLQSDRKRRNHSIGQVDYNQQMVIFDFQNKPNIE